MQESLLVLRSAEASGNLGFFMQSADLIGIEQKQNEFLIRDGEITIKYRFIDFLANLWFGFYLPEYNNSELYLKEGFTGLSKFVVWTP